MVLRSPPQRLGYPHASAVPLRGAPSSKTRRIAPVFYEDAKSEILNRPNCGLAFLDSLPTVMEFAAFSLSTPDLDDGAQPASSNYFATTLFRFLVCSFFIVSFNRSHTGSLNTMILVLVTKRGLNHKLQVMTY
jgi:hypothetical protein